MKPFEAVVDPDGNIRVASGWVTEERTGRVFQVGDSLQLVRPLEALPGPSGERSFLSTPAQYFNGGSGRNAIVKGAPGTDCPQGYFKAFTATEYDGVMFGTARLTVAVDGTTTLEDETDVIATVGTGGSATTDVPTGFFPVPATTYGADTYNGGDPFTFEVSLESVGFTFPSCFTHPDRGNALADEFAATDADHYQAVMDSSWSLEVMSDGTAALSDSTDVVAHRANGNAHNPTGPYLSTVYGEATYGDGGPFNVAVVYQATEPLESWVWIEITESTPGVILSVSNFFRGNAMPESAGTVKRVPIAATDGAGVFHQIQDGPVRWGGSAESIGLPWVTLTAAEYDALDPKDPDTLYDISDYEPV